MKMEHHMIVAAPIAAGVWFTTHNWFYVCMSVFLGVFVDADHVIDYVRQEHRFDMKDMFVKSYKGDFEYLYVIFHAYEYIPIAWIISWFLHDYTFAAVFTISYLAHMLPDQFLNNTRPWGYFLTYRIISNFEMRKIFYKGRPIKR